MFNKTTFVKRNSNRWKSTISKSRLHLFSCFLSAKPAIHLHSGNQRTGSKSSDIMEDLQGTVELSLPRPQHSSLRQRSKGTSDLKRAVQLGAPNQPYKKTVAKIVDPKKRAKEPNPLSEFQKTRTSQTSRSEKLQRVWQFDINKHSVG